MGVKKPRIPVYTAEEAMALLDQDTRDELDRHHLMKIKLAAQNRTLLKTADLSAAAFGLTYLELKRALKTLRSQDLSNLDLDDSLDCSRGIITVDSRKIFWTLDTHDADTLSARIESKSVVLSFMPLSRLASK